MQKSILLPGRMTCRNLYVMEPSQSLFGSGRTAQLARAGVRQGVFVGVATAETKI
jgi:hypothetical protein